MRGGVRSSRIVIAGGGTAGHVLPALAVADALVERGWRPERIHLYGSRRGMEVRLVPAAGYTLHALGGRGIVRRFAWSNIRSLGELAGAAISVLVRFVRDRPAVVIAVGGYASVPVVAAAVARSVPIVVVNVDAVPGIANRIAGRLAKVSAVAFEETPLPRAVVTGAPVRRAFVEASRSQPARAEARRALRIPADATLVAVVGGSLGAASLNEGGLELGRAAQESERLFVYHVAGERNYEELERRARAFGASGQYRLVAYSDEIPVLYVAADLVVSRAGAMAVAELASVGTPAVLVPLPGAPGDHQRRNAEALARQGGAMIVDDGVLTPDRFATTVLELARDTARLSEMERAGAPSSKLHAAEDIAALVDQVIAAKGETMLEIVDQRVGRGQ